MQAKITKYVNTMKKSEEERFVEERKTDSISEDWKALRLGDSVECEKGRRPEKLFEFYKNGYLPYLTAEYFREKVAKQFVDVENERGVVRVSSEDIVLIWDGSNAGDVFTGLEGVLASTMIKIEPNGQLTKPFLYYFLKTKFTDLNEKTTGSTIPHVSKTVFENLIILQPSLPEQQKTAKVLGTIQRAVGQQDKIIEAAKNLKKSLMQKLFIEGLGHTEFKETEIGQIPANWGVVRLGDVGIFQYGYTTSAIEDRTGVKFLRITDIQGEGNIIWENVPYCKLLENELEKYRLAEGDILFARIGATTGKTCIVESPPISTFGSYLIRLQIKEKSKFSPKFIYYFMNTANYWTWINANKEGKLKKGISASFLKTLPIPLPPLDEQQEVARILSTVDKKIEVEEKRKATFNELFKTMLHRLMTGEIRLKDVEV